MNTDGSSLMPADDHLPPQNLEAERWVLSAWLQDSRTIDECSEILHPGDFYRDVHQILARTILDMRDDGRTVDALTVAEELERRKEYKRLGGDEMLAEICISAPHAANAKYHAEIVHHKAIARETIQACTEIIREGYLNCLTSEELVDMAESRIFAITDRESGGDDSEAGYLAVSGLLAIERRNVGDRPGLMTGYAELDFSLDGLKPADLIILAARPSQGKTSLAMAIILKACAESDASILFHSMEMNADSIFIRLASAISGIDSRKIQRSWELSDDEMESITAAADVISRARLTINDRPNRTTGQIASNARRIKASRGLDLVVIDYLSLMDCQHRAGENRQEEVARTSRRLKGMARELNVPVLCVHQLNRQSESREDRRPRLSDLRESGQIEQDADAVLLLHRPDYYDPNDQPGLAEIIVAKNRNGPTGTVRLMFTKQCTRFDSMPVY